MAVKKVLNANDFWQPENSFDSLKREFMKINPHQRYK
jgi:hypothetical protein